MEARVEQFIENNRLFGMETNVLVAVSGGPDSMALLAIMANLREKWKLNLFVVHVNHRLRGEESNKDAELVQSFSARLGVPCNVKDVDVAAFKAEHHVGTQQAARALRYQVFQGEMERVHATVLLTAHHGDDEVETAFMKLTRGTTPLTKLGIAATRPFANGVLARPLLEETKRSIVAYCNENAIPYRIDQSNFSDAYTRNRFRMNMAPYLVEENPHIHKHIGRFDRWQEEDNHYLMEQAKAHLDQILTKKSEKSIELEIQALCLAPFPLQRRMIHLILNYLHLNVYGVNDMRVFPDAIEQIQAFLQTSAPSAQLDLPGRVQVKRAYGTCLFTTAPFIETKAYCHLLSIPGKVDTPLGVIRADTREELLELEHTDAVSFQVSQVAFPLYIRNRKPGDKLSPSGMSGSKKVNRLFIDRKVDRAKRDAWPLLVDANDSILWVPSLQTSRILTRSANVQGELLHVTFSQHKWP